MDGWMCVHNPASASLLNMYMFLYSIVVLACEPVYSCFSTESKVYVSGREILSLDTNFVTPKYVCCKS